MNFNFQSLQNMTISIVNWGEKMSKFSILCIICSTSMLTGCASTITALNNDPARVHTLRPGRFFTLSGNSRLAFQVERYDPAHPPQPYYDTKGKRWVGRMAWCAESLPEVSQAVSASSKPNLAVTGSGTLGTDESFTTTLVQTFARTEISEIYRQMGWQACQAWAQGVLSDDQYREQIALMIKSGAFIVEARAAQPLSPDAAKIIADTSIAAKKKSEEDAARKAKVAACAAKPTKECVNDLL